MDGIETLPKDAAVMTDLKFIALATETVRSLQAGNPDANGMVPERRVSDGSGLPCRHCLSDIAAGEPFLVLAHRPFPKPSPMRKPARSSFTPSPASATARRPRCRPCS